MASVIGESFTSFVDLQVKKRQKFLRKNTNYDSNFHLYNSKIPFIRLTSGVTVSEGVCKRLGFTSDSDKASCLNDNLAKNFILFSSFFQDPNESVDNILATDTKGQYISGSFRPTSDVGYGYGRTFNPPSQGFLSSPDFGFVPPPGIESMTMKTLNKGTIEEATITIVAHNLLQFQVIEALFLRLRYSLLLEWGHSTYINNAPDDYKLNPIDQTYDLYRNFLKSPGTFQAFQQKIENLREKSCGNYDAFLGVIKNFNWSLRSNGTYEITVIAISTGDVIDSLKVNSTFNSTATGIDTYFPPQFKKSTLHMYLRKLQLELEWNYYGFQYGPRDLFGSSASNPFIREAPLFNAKKIDATATEGGFYLRNTLHSTVASDAFLGVKETYPNNTTPTDLPEAFKLNFPNLSESSFYSVQDPGNYRQFAQFYLKLGALLRFMEAFLFEYNTSNNEKEPIFKLNHNRDTNWFLTTTIQTSTDPTVCIIPVQNKISSTSKFEERKYKTLFTKFDPLDSNHNDKFRTTGDGDQLNAARVDVLAEFGVPTGFEYNIFYITSIKYDIWPLGGSSALTTQEQIYSVPKKLLLPNGSSVNYASMANGGVYYNDPPRDLKDGLDSDKINYPYQVEIEKILADEIYNVWQASGTNTDVNQYQVRGATVELVTHTDRSPTTKVISAADKTSSGFPHIQAYLPDFVDGDRARTMDILVSLEYIMSVVDDTGNQDKDGNISVLKFLNALMNGIGKALGGINDFDVTYDKVGNTFRIIDNTYIANSGKDDVTEIQINLLTDNSGTFVRDVNLKTELTARVANAIAAGAQKNGNTMVSNGTTFAKFNEGLIDRIIETKQNSNCTPGSGNSVYINRYNILLEYIKSLYAGSLTREQCSSMGGVAKDLFQYEIGEGTSGNQLNGTMFIPLNLQLTLDGISGVKQYQLFKVNQELIPAVYHNRLAFIVKGINHKVSKDGWQTTIETLAVNKPVVGEVNSYVASVLEIKPEDIINAESFPTGNDADFWSLVTICIFEDGTPQGRADVAQSIYNRVLSDVYSGASTIKEVIVADGQYEPAFDPADRSRTATPWLAINDKTTAIAAIKFNKPAWDDVLIQTKLKESFEAISNPTLQAEALNYIENRADFLGKGLGTSWRQIIYVDDPLTKKDEISEQWSSGDSSTVPRRRDPDRNIFANVVGPGAYKWGLKNLKANPPSQSWFDSYKSQFP